jgi:hypothetical protein
MAYSFAMTKWTSIRAGRRSRAAVKEQGVLSATTIMPHSWLCFHIEMKHASWVPRVSTGMVCEIPSMEAGPRPAGDPASSVAATTAVRRWPREAGWLGNGDDLLLADPLRVLTLPTVQVYSSDAAGPHRTGHTANVQDSSVPNALEDRRASRAAGQVRRQRIHSLVAKGISLEEAVRRSRRVRRR